MNQGRLEQAIRAYGKAASIGPAAPSPFFQRAWLLFMVGRFDEATADYVDGMSLEPNVRVALTSVASVFAAIGDAERADRWMSAAEAVIPDQPATRATRMLLLAHQNRWAEARQLGEAWTRQAPNNQFAYGVSARVAFASGDFEVAATLAEQAHRLSPGARSSPGMTAESILGASYIRIGRVDEGAALLRELIEDVRSNIESGEQRPGLMIEMAAAYAELGDVDAAVRWLEAAYDAGWRHNRWTPGGISPFSKVADDPRFQGWLARVDQHVEEMGARISEEHLATLDAMLRRWYELNPDVPMPGDRP